MIQKIKIVFDKLKIKLTFQIWEVFTTLSVVLTLFSLFLLGSRAFSKNYKVDLIKINQAKIEIYNLLSAQDFLVKKPIITSYSEVNNNYCDYQNNLKFKNINLNSLLLLDKKINDKKTSIQNDFSKEEYKQLNYFLDFAVTTSKDYQKFYSINNNLIEKWKILADYLQNWCEKNYYLEFIDLEKIEDFNNFLAEQGNFDNFNLQNNFLELKQFLKAILEKEKEFNKNDLIKNINQIIDIIYNLDKNKNKVGNENLKKQIIELENWEKLNLQKQLDAKTNIVFIN